jgi:hypothetical protein
MSVPEHVPAKPAGIFEWQRALRGNIPTKHIPCAWALAGYANRDGSSVRPGQQRLCDDTGSSRSTIARSLAWLTENGWLICVEAAGKCTGGKGMANVYQLAVPVNRVSSEAQPCVASDTPPHQFSPSESLTLAQPSVEPMTDDYNSQAAFDWIDEQVHGLDGWEPTYVDARLSQGSHPKAIVNGVLAVREAA